jgi:hypothetical protein
MLYNLQSEWRELFSRWSNIITKRKGNVSGENIHLASYSSFPSSECLKLKAEPVDSHTHLLPSPSQSLSYAVEKFPQETNRDGICDRIGIFGGFKHCQNPALHSPLIGHDNKKIS